MSQGGAGWMGGCGGVCMSFSDEWGFGWGIGMGNQVNKGVSDLGGLNRFGDTGINGFRGLELNLGFLDWN